MQHNVFTFFSVYNCLDEDFDAPDIAADHDLCRGIMAGRVGLHPDVWGSHDPLTMPPPHHRKPWRPPIGYPADRVWEWNPYKPRLVPQPKQPKQPKQRPKPRAPAPFVESYFPPPADGTLQLTCDVCKRARFGGTVNYHGDRPAKVAEIRALGRIEGWTCIAGTDRCPRCSEVPPPQAKGNGTGTDQGHEQHADGG